MADDPQKPNPGNVPQIIGEPSPAYYEALRKRVEEEAKSRRERIPIPTFERIERQQVVGGLQGFARGWNTEIEQALALPETLLHCRLPSCIEYAADPAGGAARVLEWQQQPVTLPATDYGMFLYETASSIYFVLYDERRRIAVRERLSCLHKDPPEGDWAAVRRAIVAAADRANAVCARENDLVVYHDGHVRVLRACPRSSASRSAGRRRSDRDSQWPCRTDFSRTRPTRRRC